MSDVHGVNAMSHGPVYFTPQGQKTDGRDRPLKEVTIGDSGAL